MKPREVIIIGGGLAGSAAAIRLAQRGTDVLLIEKEAVPHHKVCGEFISIEACQILRELKIDLRQLGAAPVDRLCLTSGPRSATVSLGFQAQSLSRKRLDQALLQQAEVKGAEVLQGNNVTGLTFEDGLWHVAIHGGPALSAKAVFLASGKYDVRGWQRPETDRTHYIGFKNYFRLTPGQQAALAGGVELFLFNGGYAGLETVEDGLANLCLIVTSRRYAACGKSWDSVLQAIAGKTPSLAERLQDSTPQWEKPLAVAGIPYGYVYRPDAKDKPGLFRLGDQLAVIPSLCGDGMAIALHSGLLAADYFYSADARQYHIAARRQLLGQIRTASALSAVLATAPGRMLAPVLCRSLPSLARRLAQQTRVQAAAAPPDAVDLVAQH